MILNLARYLRVFLPMSLFGWFFSEWSIKKLSIGWTAASISVQTTCQAGKNDALCGAYTAAIWTRSLSVTVLAAGLCIVLTAFSLPRLPSSLKQIILQRPRFIGCTVLSLTFIMVLLRGTITTLCVWFIPRVAWGYDTIAFASVIGLTAITRVPAHAKAVALLVSGTATKWVGKIVSADEAPSAWSLVEAICHEISVPLPQHLILGLAPDCQMHMGTVLLEPAGQKVNGTNLYLGGSLAATLGENELRNVLRQALYHYSSNRPTWLLAARNWAEDAQTYLDTSGISSNRRHMAAAIVPALVCWQGWIRVIRAMIHSVENLDVHPPTTMSEDKGKIISTAILSNAMHAWKTDTLPRFLLAITNGKKQPPVMDWFYTALCKTCIGIPDFAAHDPKVSSLYEELIQLEQQWMIQSGQAMAPD